MKTEDRATGGSPPNKRPSRFAGLRMAAVCSLVLSAFAHPCLGRQATESESDPSTATLRAMQVDLDSLIDDAGSNFRGDNERAVLARRILEVDEDNPVAHHALGMVYARRYEQKAGLQRRRPNVVLQRQVDRNRQRALDHFNQSLVSNPRRPAIYRQMMRFFLKERDYEAISRLTATMRQQLPYERDTWLYSGFSAVNDNQPDEAASFFSRAFMFMDEKERADYLATDWILRLDSDGPSSSDSAAFWSEFWEERRPRFLPAENERLLAHYERVVRCDLMYPYWRKYKNDGWTITPGNVVLRYGAPRAEYGYLAADERSRVFNLSYPWFTFTFTDWTRNGEYLIVETAPRAGETPAPGALTKARSMFNSLPDEHQLAAGIRELPVSFLATRLRADEPNQINPAPDVELLVASGVPLEAHDSVTTIANVRVRTGAFVVDERNKLLDSQTRSFFGMAENGYVMTPEGNLWCMVATLHPTVDASQVSVEFEVEGTRLLGASKADLAVAPVTADSLRISDVLLAHLITEHTSSSSRPCHFERGSLDIFPAPTTLLDRAAPLYLYVESYNLERDSTGATRSSIEVGIQKHDDEPNVLGRLWRNILNRKDETGVATRVEVVGSQRDSGDYLIVDLSDEEPGDYVLGVRVTDMVSGVTRETSRIIYLR